jgi:hypothetical protein
LKRGAQWTGVNPFNIPLAVFAVAESRCSTRGHRQLSEPAKLFRFACSGALMSTSSIATGDVMSENSAVPRDPLSEMVIVSCDSGFVITGSGTVEFSRPMDIDSGPLTPCLPAFEV